MPHAGHEAVLCPAVLGAGVPASLCFVDEIYAPAQTDSNQTVRVVAVKSPLW